MKSIKYVLFALAFSLLFVSCEKGRFLTSITGSPFEVLVVANNDIWKSNIGHQLLDSLTTPMRGMPQREPSLSISHCTENQFTSMLKPTRNILIVQIDSAHYTKANLIVSKNKWARPQYIAKLVAPCKDSIASFLTNRGGQITEFFVQAEREREIAYLRKKYNRQLSRMVYEKLGMQINVPSTLTLYKWSEDSSAIWLSTGATNVRQDLVIYTYPYTNTSQLTLENLNAKRDSVLKTLIPGPVDGSYMGTEYRVSPPEMKVLNLEGKFCAEIKGLWRVQGKTMMGGPYVSHTMVEETTNRIVTIEGFVYAPQQSKRNAIRQIEAATYTLSLPAVANAVIVTGDKEEQTE